MTLTLRSSGASPFVRKVRLAAAILGLTDEIVMEHADTLDASDSIRQQNPLGKIPALILEDGRILYDSRVILEFLDHRAGGGGIIPTATDERFEALRIAALADGILESAILIVYEGRYRPGQEPYEPWLEHQRNKIRGALANLQSSPPSIEPVTVGAIGAACALGYLDFRNQVDWRPDYAGLIAWLDQFANAVPAYEETKPQT